MRIIFTLLFLAACSSHRGKLEFSTEKIFYTDAKTERQSGEAYVPTKGENLPGVVLVHGGGWDSRDYTDNRSIAESLASHGYTVININYRYEKHPAPVDDLGTAIAWWKKNAEKFKLDPKKIGLWGYSAGGHITSLHALKKIGTTDAVQSVVSGGAPYDLTWYTHGKITTPYMGGRRDLLVKEYFEASPSYHVKAGAPPFFLYHGKNDKLVEYSQMTAFDAKLRLHQNFVKRHKVPFWGHAFTFILYDEAVKKGIKFLDIHLKGNGP